MTTFAGREGVNRYVTLVLAHGLEFYAKSGIKPNSAWTPTNMLRRAEELTGRRYKRGEYLRAAADLRETLEPDFDVIDEDDS